MPHFRVHVVLADLTTRKYDFRTEFAEGARELAVKQLKAEGETGYRIGKAKLIRDSNPCCCRQ